MRLILVPTYLQEGRINMFPSVNIFGKDIGINWVLIVISCIIMAVINVIRAKKYNLRKWHGVVIAILVNIFAIFSAILMYNLETINGDGFKMGLSFFGTVFFLPIFMFILSFLFKTKKDEFMDYWALTIPMELALVRFGCFLSGCCLGIQASHGVHFPFEPEGVYRVPVQLYEVIFDLLIFTGLIIVEKKINLKGTIMTYRLYAPLRMLQGMKMQAKKKSAHQKGGHKML